MAIFDLCFEAERKPKAKGAHPVVYRSNPKAPYVYFSTIRAGAKAAKVTSDTFAKWLQNPGRWDVRRWSDLRPFERQNVQNLPYVERFSNEICTLFSTEELKRELDFESLEASFWMEK